MDEMQGLRDEVQRLLAAALQSDTDHAAEIARLAELTATDLADFLVMKGIPFRRRIHCLSACAQ